MIDSNTHDETPERMICSLIHLKLMPIYLGMLVLMGIWSAFVFVIGRKDLIPARIGFPKLHFVYLAIAIYKEKKEAQLNSLVNTYNHYNTYKRNLIVPRLNNNQPRQSQVSQAQASQTYSQPSNTVFESLFESQNNVGGTSDFWGEHTGSLNGVKFTIPKIHTYEVLSSYHSDGTPRYLFHGVPNSEIARKVFESNTMQIGESKPLAVWFTDDFNYAREIARKRKAYQGGSTFVLVFMISPGEGLVPHKDFWIVPCDGDAEEGDLVESDAFVPVALFDENAKLLEIKQT